MLSPEAIDKLRKIKHLALDMDGTIYKGKTLFPFTKNFLDGLTAGGIGYTFLTNNSSKSVSEYARKLTALGLDASGDKVFTSALATIKYLEKTHTDSKRVMILGTDGLKQEFRDAGYEVVRDEPGDEPELVIVGFDTSLNYAKLTVATYWIDQGKPYIATHPDNICPTDEKLVLVDCGAICAAIEAATGKTPEAVPGKPNALMLEGLMEAHGLEKNELGMVGDRLYTDIAMACETGVVGVLVLTGEATLEDLEASPFKPDIVLQSVRELGEQLKLAQNTTT